jgi:hypothetical protein
MLPYMIVKSDGRKDMRYPRAFEAAAATPSMILCP